MNWKSHLVYDALWIAHPVLQFAVVAVMYWRKQHRIFPIFFAYLGFQIAGFMILFPLHKWGEYSHYFYVSSNFFEVLGSLLAPTELWYRSRFWQPCSSGAHASCIACQRSSIPSEIKLIQFRRLRRSDPDLAHVRSDQSPGTSSAANVLMSQRWEQGLTELQHPSSSDSLIPIFEGMVDRAFSRTGGPQLLE